MGSSSRFTFGDDNFCLDGEKLVAVEIGELPETLYQPAGTLIKEYRTERESFTRVLSYTRYSHNRDFPEEWVTLGRDGLIHYYGTARDSDVAGLRNQPNAIIPSTLAWLRHRTADRHGNLIDYTYYQPLANSAARLLQRVEWGHALSGPYENATRRRIEFTYTTENTNETKWVAGLNVAQDQTLKQIDIYAPHEQGASHSPLARRYKLSHKASLFTGDPLLDSAEVCGPLADSCLPATTFEYEDALVALELKSERLLHGQFDGWNWNPTTGRRLQRRRDATTYSTTSTETTSSMETRAIT